MTATAALVLRANKKAASEFLKTSGCRQLASRIYTRRAFAMRMSPLKIESAILRRRERLSIGSTPRGAQAADTICVFSASNNSRPTSRFTTHTDAHICLSQIAAAPCQWRQDKLAQARSRMPRSSLPILGIFQLAN